MEGFISCLDLPILFVLGLPNINEALLCMLSDLRRHLITRHSLIGMESHGDEKPAHLTKRLLIVE